MFITTILRAKKAKAKHILVMMESLATSHRFVTVRERLADKLELIRFDPFIQMDCVYREKKKIKSVRENIEFDPNVSIDPVRKPWPEPDGLLKRIRP